MPVGADSAQYVGESAHHELTDEDLQVLYNWVDEIPLSRPKRNISRDFSDGVLTAEVVKHFFPKFVDLHNYSAAHSVSQKMYNWNTLNIKVFKKMDLVLNRKEIENVVNMVPDSVERVLLAIKIHIEQKQSQKRNYEPAAHNNNGNNNFNMDLGGAGFGIPQGGNKENFYQHENEEQ